MDGLEPFLLRQIFSPVHRLPLQFLNIPCNFLFYGSALLHWPMPVAAPPWSVQVLIISFWFPPSPAISVMRKEVRLRLCCHPEKSHDRTALLRDYIRFPTYFQEHNGLRLLFSPHEFPVFLPSDWIPDSSSRWQQWCPLQVFRFLSGNFRKSPWSDLHLPAFRFHLQQAYDPHLRQMQYRYLPFRKQLLHTVRPYG